MSNGTDTQAYNCAAGVCCDSVGDKDKRVRALSEMIRHDLGHEHPTVENVARIVLTRFDLVKAGLLQPLIDWVAKNARDFPYE